jgi:hypothetical protein
MVGGKKWKIDMASVAKSEQGQERGENYMVSNK